MGDREMEESLAGISEPLPPLSSVHDFREDQRVALLEGVNLDGVGFILLESSGGQWQPVEPGSMRLETRQDRVLAWTHPDATRAARHHRALASELVAIAMEESPDADRR